MENDKRIKLIVDSSVDLPRELLQENDVEILSYEVSINGKSYLDGIDITTQELFELIDKYKVLPKTSAMRPQVFEEAYSKFASDYESVIYIGLGSGFSSNYNNAYLASQEFDNVYTIDSGNLSSGTGLLVLKIMKFIKEGKMTAQEIVDEINRLVPLVRCQFIVDTLKYLHMGGRCKATTKYVAAALRIKPIIAVVNGKMEITKKPIGYKKGLNIMLEQAFDYKDIMDLDHIMVTHPMADKDAAYLKEELSKVFDKNIIFETRAGGTIATHCGPRTIGILYILKENK